MEELSYGNKIFKLLQSLERNLHKPDLHSFTSHIKGGTAFVECRFAGDIFIQQNYGNEKHIQWCGGLIAASNRLEMLELDLSSIKM